MDKRETYFCFSFLYIKPFFFVLFFLVVKHTKVSSIFLRRNIMLHQFRHASTSAQSAVTANGVRVITVPPLNSYPKLASVGLFLKGAASVNETRNNVGVSHFLRRLALKVFLS